MTTTHIATIGTSADTVTGDHCNLVVYRAKAEIDPDRVEYVADGNSVWSVDLTVRVGGDHEVAIAEADKVLAGRGMTRVGGWVDGDNALYAEVDASQG